MSAFLLGHTPHRSQGGAPVGQLALHDGRPGYRIDGVDRMPPFLTTVVSAGNVWLYATSAGVLAAGRRDPGRRALPLRDRRSDVRARRARGGRTVVFARPTERDVPERRWEPFLRAADGLYDMERSLWRSRLGDELVLSEHNRTLGLTIHVAYTCDETFGLQRRVRLESSGEEPLKLRVLDGLVDVQAADVDRGVQESLSCLVDAYRISELDGASGLAVFRLNSIPVDRAVRARRCSPTSPGFAGSAPGRSSCRSRTSSASVAAKSSTRARRARRCAAIRAHSSRSSTPTSRRGPRATGSSAPTRASTHGRSSGSPRASVPATERRRRSSTRRARASERPSPRWCARRTGIRRPPSRCTTRATRRTSSTTSCAAARCAGGIPAASSRSTSPVASRRSTSAGRRRTRWTRAIATRLSPGRRARATPTASASRASGCR